MASTGSPDWGIRARTVATTTTMGKAKARPMATTIVALYAYASFQRYSGSF